MDQSSLWAALGYFQGLSASEVKGWLDLGLYYGILFTALVCLFRLRTILRVLTEFNRGRGPLWDLRSTVEDLKDLEPKLKATIGQVSTLTAQMGDLKEQVEALRVQLAELQVETISQRTGESETSPTVQVAPESSLGSIAHDEDAEERNWEMLRDYWRRNTRRLEYIIDQISDGRVKGAFDRLPRTNYGRIIHKLQGQGRITAAVAKASKDLIDEFNRYRPRNRSIPDEVVGGLSKLDEMLDKELISIASVDAAEAAEDVAAPLATTTAEGIKPNGELSVAGAVRNPSSSISTADRL